MFRAATGQPLPMWSYHCLRITVTVRLKAGEPVRPKGEARRARLVKPSPGSHCIPAASRLKPNRSPARRDRPGGRRCPGHGLWPRYVSHMTSVVAWERQVGTLSEMVIASDSRLGGGERWDACAKIFDVGREDSVLAFAGHTWRALPLALQAVATTSSYNGSVLRTLDLPQFASHLENVLNVVLGEAKGEAAAQAPDCEFLLAGWSWKLNSFRIYRYTFDRVNWRFTGNPSGPQPPRALRGPGRDRWFATIGDGGWRLQGVLARAYGTGLISGPFDYHPLECLYRQTQDSAELEHSVGGPVQVSKVYRSIRVEHFAVRTPNGLFVSGRPVLPYENLDLRAIERSATGAWTTAPSAPQIPAASAALQELEATSERTAVDAIDHDLA